MRKLYVAATEACRSAFECEREVIDFDNANFTEVSIAVMTAEEAKAGKLERVESTAFGIPVVILNECGEVIRRSSVVLTASLTAKPMTPSFTVVKSIRLR